MLRVFLVLLFQSPLLAFCHVPPLSAGEPESGSTDASPAILIVGDSLSAGFGLRPGEAWPNLLEARLDEQGLGGKVVNASISGDTTRGALSRLPRALEVHSPDIVIIELGGNDGLRGFPLQVMRDNLAAMIDMSHKAGARVLLLGIQLPANYGPDYTGEFRRLYADLAAAHEVPYTPFMREEVALNPELMQDDGVHPNADAQPLMLDYVWSELAPMLEGTATSGVRHAADAQ